VTDGEARRRWLRRGAIVAVVVAATAFVGGSILVATLTGRAPGQAPQTASSAYYGGSTHPPSPSARWVRERLVRSPPALAALHEQGGRLLAGDLMARLRELRGRPVVVNAWASWCAPCRDELPLMARVAARFGRRAAFVGADVDDSAGGARSLLADEHLSYPSYQTTADDVRSLTPVVGFPTTIYVGRDGHVVGVHPGQYPDTKALAADVRRYLNDRR
jgi:cytochrome c biogenesis protein CcmG/thiol:disulfide interchange protein DsbE